MILNRMNKKTVNTISDIMTNEVPTCGPKDSLQSVFQLLSSKEWQSIHNVYVIDHERKLLGFVEIAKILQPNHTVPVVEVMQPVSDFLRPTDYLEEAVYLAIKNDVEAVPVLDNKERLAGAVTSKMIIDILHSEHIEDALLTVGVRSKKTNIVKLTSERTFLTVKSRAPWLVVGLLVGLFLGLITSFFEESLQDSIAIAYFIPVVAYVAGSVGNQTGAIAVRAIAMLRIRYGSYLMKEFFAGIVLGLIVGVVGALGAFLISRSSLIAIAVGLSLVIASTMATVLASLIPFVFKFFKKDPALGSGPIANAVLDVLSVIVYFFIATAIVT